MVSCCFFLFLLLFVIIIQKQKKTKNSLSLEYHPNESMSCDKSLIPPIRYLQCPAAVTIRHLQRFLSSKFNLNLDSKNVTIEIIYENEVLSITDSLMDVAYSFNWKRVSFITH